MPEAATSRAACMPRPGRWTRSSSSSAAWCARRSRRSMVAARATRAACRSRERGGGGGKAACAGARPPELLRRQGEGDGCRRIAAGRARRTGTGVGRGGWRRAVTRSSRAGPLAGSARESGGTTWCADMHARAGAGGLTCRCIVAALPALGLRAATSLTKRGPLLYVRDGARHIAAIRPGLPPPPADLQQVSK